MSVIVNQLTKVYGTQIAVNHISFTAEPGKIVGFLGPNGAGKSTTMKMITGFIPPSDGTASVCGFDINTQSMDVRKCLGYLPENNPLYLDMYVKEFLAFVAGLQQLNNVESRIKEMIEQTGLEREQYKKISQLSKGYRQRVGLAQAMLHDPKVLILDEPTTGLDPNQLVEIRKLIKQLGKEKNNYEKEQKKLRKRTKTIRKRKKQKRNKQKKEIQRHRRERRGGERKKCGTQQLHHDFPRCPQQIEVLPEREKREGQSLFEASFSRQQLFWR